MSLSVQEVSTLSIQEISIITAAKDLSPSILNQDFLKYSDIVPSDWQYKQEPIFASNVAQIIYDNGVSITAQPNRVAFAQVVAAKNQVEFYIEAIATKFAEKLPNADYQAVGINLKGLVPFFEPDRDAHTYLFKTLFSAGSWQDFGQGPAQAAIQLSYEIEQGQLNLAINEANLQTSEGKKISAIMFSSNFNYPLQGEVGTRRLQRVQERIRLWQSSAKSFQQLINNHFLETVPTPATEADIPLAPAGPEDEMVL